MEGRNDGEQNERAVARRRTENGVLPSNRSSHSESVKTRDELAGIGEQIKALQTQLSNLAPDSKPTTPVLQILWSLLWRLRPFLFLASPLTAAQWGIGGQQYHVHHRGHYSKDAAHVAIALRLYLVLLRCSVVCVAAALHGCLTLLGILAVLNDPGLPSWMDMSDRLIDGLIFLSRALHSGDCDGFAQLLNVIFDLLSEVTLHFCGTKDEEGDGVPCALYLQLSAPRSTELQTQAEVLLTSVRTPRESANAEEGSTLLRQVFSTVACVETLYEARCIQSAVLRLVVRLGEEHILVSLSPDRVALLSDVCCHLLAAGMPGEESRIVNKAQHDAAWHMLHYLAQFDGRLLPHVEGPLILWVLTSQWTRRPHGARGSVFEITAAEWALFEWCFYLGEMDLDSLIAAAHRRSSILPGGQSTLLDCFTQMFSIAVRWCVELYGAASSGSGACDLESSKPNATHDQFALITLRNWVEFCERVFRSFVSYACRSSPSSTRSIADEYAHRLQLLVNEIPLSTFTANLLCAGIPRFPVVSELAFLPIRVLSLFRSPALDVCVAEVLRSAKDYVDVSAYRLLEANALALRARFASPLPAAQLHDGAAFEEALTETLRVIQHHDSPASALLTQAILLLIHFFPDPTEEDEGCTVVKSEVILRVMHELEEASATAKPREAPVGYRIEAPLSMMLYREAALALYRGGSGLRWSRRVLAEVEKLPALPIDARATLLSNIAGIASGLQGALIEAVSKNQSPARLCHELHRDVSLYPTSTARNPTESRGATCRPCDDLVGQLTPAIPLLQALSSILKTLLQEKQLRRALMCDESSEFSASGMFSFSTAVSSVFDSVAAILICFLDLKYRVSSVLAAPPMRSHRSQPQPSSLPEHCISNTSHAQAVIIDVDDSDTEHDRAGAAAKKAHQGRRKSKTRSDYAAVDRSTYNLASSTHMKGPDAETERETLAPIGSRIQLLEKIIDLNATQIRPALLEMLRSDEVEAGIGKCAAPPVAGDVPSSSYLVSPRGEEGIQSELYASLQRCAYASVALAPPYATDELGDSLFQCAKVHPARSPIAQVALRELMLWRHSTCSEEGSRDATAETLLALSGEERLIPTVLSAMREANHEALVAAGNRVLLLLRFARHFFQRQNASSSKGVLDEGSRAAEMFLCGESVRLQESCLAASERVAQEGRSWLCLCYDLYTAYLTIPSTHQQMSLSITGLSVETARDIMLLLSWSATDLLRLRERPFVFSSFLRVVVDKEDQEMQTVIASSLDVLGRYLVSSSGATPSFGDDAKASAVVPPQYPSTAGESVATLHPVESHPSREQLRNLMEQEKIADWRAAAGGLAYVLYESGKKSVARQLRDIEEVMHYVHKEIKDVPSMVRSTIEMVAFHIVSLEADAQLLACTQRQRSGRQRRGSRCECAGAWSATAGILSSPTHSLFCCRCRKSHNESVGGDTQIRRGNRQRVDGTPKLSVEDPEDGGDDESDVLDPIAFSIFERALEQLVTLSESAETVAGVEKALKRPVACPVAAEELRKNMFAVLDAVYKAIHIEPSVNYWDDYGDGALAGRGDSLPGSLRARRRWLLGLASFIRFMGSQTTPLALMLPTLLSRCSSFPLLVSAVCIVWRELVYACTDEYLVDSAASIALSFVCLEQHATLGMESRMLLQGALRRLYERTAAAPFWSTYKALLGTLSTLVRVALTNQVAPRAEPAEKIQDHDVDSAPSLLTGFVSVMRSGSLQATTAFVRALYEYLSSADVATIHRISTAAAARPQVLHTLLRCSEADAESALYAMRCVSILGAVSTPMSITPARKTSVTASPESDAQNLPASSCALSSSVPDTWGRMTWTQSSFLDAETVLNWRKFSFTLLSEYFPRVFASTADPVLHNRIAFAVQELLRASTRQERLQNKGVELRRDDTVHVDELNRYIWWARLTPHVKQLLGGFTTTRYSLTVNWKTQLRSPEYHPGMEYRRWLFAFFNHLVSLCCGWFAEMIQPLRNVAKKNASLILYLLPYLVVHLLESGKQPDVHYIEGEFKAVMEAVDGGSHLPPLSLRSQSIYEANPEGATTQEPREHVHTILSLLEDIEQLRWPLLRDRGRIRCVFEQVDHTESVCVRLADLCGEFTRSIPWSMRCHAALRIGSYLRALRSVESQRRIPFLSSVNAVVPLQRIFAALNDRKSARSIHRASPGLSLEDTAFSFENNGDWLCALGSAELVLQHHPTSGQHQLTALHCMNELGELYMTSQYAASLLNGAPGYAHLSYTPVSRKDAEFSHSRTGSSFASSSVDKCKFGSLNSAVQLRSHILSYANEAAWRLGQWDALLPHCQAEGKASIISDVHAGTCPAEALSVNLAIPAAYLQQALSGASSLSNVYRVTDAERAKVVPLVRTPCPEDLAARGSSLALLLHALGDVDAVSQMCANAFVAHTCDDGDEQVSQRSLPFMKLAAPRLPSPLKEEIASFLVRRESYVEETIGALEPLLALHRLVYRELDMPQNVAETWLRQAELLRDAGLGEAALTAARQAAFESPKHIAKTNYYVLVANLLHDTQSPTPAMEFARECLADSNIPAATRAHLQMLLTNWLIDTGSERPERVFAEYDKARELDSKSELLHHQTALFYDHLHTLSTNASEGAAAQLTAVTTSVTTSSSKTSTEVSAGAVYQAVLQHQGEMMDSIQRYAVHAVFHYGEALLLGAEKASVSLPRMLTLWLDGTLFLGGLLNTAAGKIKDAAARTLEEMNSRIREVILSTVSPVIPPAVVMTALPQLLSRLGHPVASVRLVLTDAVLYLLSHFPQQCLWLVLPMALSKVGPKEVVETQIIKQFADSAPNEKVLRNAKVICDALLSICNCSASLFPKEKGLTQLSTVQKVTPLLAAAKFIVPILSNFTPDIHASVGADVFPTTPCFHHFDDRVIVMRSLQKPKRIWVHTDDGRQMSFLCKAKDEPRKDIRMMEVAALMNSFFLSDPEAKRKRFSLRRYSITALSDDCAVIEWLNDTAPLAKVAMECYALDRSGVHISTVKKWVALVGENKLTKMDLFTKYIFPEAPPVMHQWLDRNFPSNQSWYEARTLFTQSTALWSIAGHVVGLGDRHAENLMVDMKSGELMHVDFACMFDKGEKLEVPERVRFRLTQNLTDTMGVLGAYGPFEATCEVALRCEMRNKSAVMSIVETLLHEPLVEWKRQSAPAQSLKGPKQLMERVARRLDGFLDLYTVPPQRDTLSLNVESQVSKLIHSSSDMENLSQMYIWWMAWI